MQILILHQCIHLGRDASRSFHTGGTSKEDLTDDLTGLEDEGIAGVYGWLTFYKKQYPQIGLLYFLIDSICICFNNSKLIL
jgi:hypothetical protein